MILQEVPPLGHPGSLGIEWKPSGFLLGLVCFSTEFAIAGVISTSEIHSSRWIFAMKNWTLQVTHNKLSKKNPGFKSSRLRFIGFATNLL